MTETCDLAALDAYGEPEAARRFGLLVFCDGEVQVRLLDEGGTAVIGREPPCEIVVHDPSISRQHARFSRTSGEVWLEDLDSRNGTLLRGRRIQRERLEPADEVHIGKARIVLAGTRGAAETDASAGAKPSEDLIVGSPVMKKLYEDAVRAARVNLPVLVLGETGVGKEHIARTLHSGGDRRDGPFVVVNCAAIPGSLIESTFFGHERGAFTGAVARSTGAFERAHGGVLFLDEIGELSSSAQAALLRAIETRRIARVGSTVEIDVDVRIVAATHCDLEAMIEDGTFRQDLFFRLNGMKLEVPPLRARKEEIEPLVRLFIERARREWDLRARAITPDAIAAISRFGWPGNVRQLRHAIERAALLATRETIDVADLPDYVLGSDRDREESPSPTAALSDLALREQLRRYEQALIEEALRRAAGNRRAAAKLLRIPVRTLFRKIRSSGVPSET